MSDAFWKSVYEGVRPEDLPWFSPTPDPDLTATLEKLGVTPGAALDLGSGPGIHAIALAKRGWKVTAVDISPGAIRMASQFALQADVKIDFRTIDVLSFQPSPNSYDLVHDRGFLHTLESSEWPRWTSFVASTLKPGGIVIAKEFTYNPRRRFGPRGFTKSELQNVLDGRFKIDSLEQSTFRGPRFEAAAFLLVARRESSTSV
jgi:cyclopropane fatty-acyl-phospholipid synthase-like methyltransferase